MAKKIIIDGVIGIDTQAHKIRDLIESANGDELHIDIASPGGFVYDGLEIFNLLRDYSRNQNKVTTKLTGLAASMASYIALAGDRVIAEDNAVFMIHNVWGITIGDYRQMQKEAKVMEGLTELLASCYRKKTKKKKGEIREMMDNETYLFGEEMVKEGFVDEIVKTENNKGSKDELVMLAQARIQNCFKIMEKSEKSKNDMRKAASIIDVFNISDDQEKIITLEEKQGEEKNNMDERLQLKIGELEIENKNLKNKLENIQAHLEFSDIAPNEVLEAIKKNEEFSAKIHAAKYAKLQMKAELMKNRADDNPQDLNIGNNDALDEDAEVEKLVNQYNKNYGGAK